MQDEGVGSELLWLDTFQQVVTRAAHELKGALNGVAVNLEVVRGRAAQDGQPASAVARFAGSAATQLDLVIEMNEALLALGRRPREPVDVGGALRQLAALLVPVAQAARKDLHVSVAADGMAANVGVSGALVRTVLARAVMAVMDAGGGSVHLGWEDGAVVVQLAATQGTLELDARTAAAAAAAGVDIGAVGSALLLTFPVPTPAPAPTGAPTHETA